MFPLHVSHLKHVPNVVHKTHTFKIRQHTYIDWGTCMRLSIIRKSFIRNKALFYLYPLVLFIYLQYQSLTTLDHIQFRNCSLSSATSKSGVNKSCFLIGRFSAFERLSTKDKPGFISLSLKYS